MDNFFAVKKREGILCTLAVILLSISAVAQPAPKWKRWAAEGDTLYQHQDFVGASKAYSKAINLSGLKDKESFPLLYRRAVCYYSLEKFRLALADLDAFEQKNSDSSQAKLMRALIYRELGDNEKQLIYLNQAMAMRTPRAEMFRWRGLLFLQQEKFEEAKIDLLRARNMEDDPETETYLGLTFYNLAEPDSAIASFNRSIEMDPTHLPAFLYAGSISLEQGAYELSIEYLNLALRLDPKNKEALFYKGAALVESKKIDEGCRCLNRAFYLGMDDAAEYLKEYCFESEN